MEICLLPDGETLIVELASRLTDFDRQLIRAHEEALLAALAPRLATSVTPDSRHPLLSLRGKIEAIEAEAVAWTGRPN